MKKNKFITIFVWLLITALFIFLTLNKHSRSGIFNYHSEIWADKAGYYVYLPLTFIYHFDASSFPDSITDKIGGGFIIDTINNVVKTKCNYGVALLQAPFFLIVHFIAKPLGYPDNGFSMPYNRSIDFAAVFYLVMGLFFLWKYLNKRFSKKLSFFALFFLIAATNLYYYAIDETGMSHIYSFAIFATLIWLIDFFDLKKQTHLLLLSLLFALLIVVRPINIIFILFLILLQKDKLKLWLSDFKKIKPQKTIIVLLPAMLIISLQFFYWKYASGNYFSYSYKGESFTNLFNPQIFKVWFSTQNGLFIYTPIWLFIIIGIGKMIFDKQKNGWMYLSLFFVLSYIIASWWSWSMGCGFGNRAYVEYLTIFITPAIFLWKKIATSKILSYSIICLFVLCAIYNLQLTYAWDGCWYGGIWDWQLLWQKFLSTFN